jgi:hypothetical protein
MLRRNEKYFEERKVSELIKFAYAPVSISRLQGLSYDFRDVYESYSDGMTRVLNLAKHSVWLPIHSMAFGMRLAKAIHDETGDFSLSFPTMRRINDSIRLRMMEVAQDHKPKHLKTLIKRITGINRTLLQRVDADTVASYDALMPSLLVLAWSSFEVLCEDLLKKCIEIRPHLLPPTKGRPNARKLSSWETLTPKGKTVTHGPKSKFNRQPRLDDLEFRTLRAIRDSYWITFVADYQRIDRALNHRCLDNLQAVRNIVVHTGGIVDDVFLNRTTGVPMFSKSSKGDPLQIDFGMVKNLIVPVRNRGIQLMDAVNNWILKHP